MFNPPPIRFRPGAKALIVQNHKILVIKEKIAHVENDIVLYDFPGGGMELGETVEEALQREVFEEVGLKVKIIKPLGSWDFIALKIDEASQPVHIICLGFQCKVVGETIIDTNHNPADEDIFATMWLSVDEIKALPVSQWSCDIKPILQNLSL